MKDMSLVMKEAHKMTKEIKKEFPEVDYKFQLGICMSYLLNRKGENEMVELQGSEKQVKWALSIREKTISTINEAINFLEEGQQVRIKRTGKRAQDIDERIRRIKLMLEEVKNEQSSKVFIEKWRFKDLAYYLEFYWE
ncbi:hypothetical protein [Clostridium perfringens]|uniref:hypothetical protein n=1 Tax=Clostridium phage phiSM101 TaxID=396359 RepID=UPI0000DB6837|nr:hypothetical protein [Clostridium perfringens]YP_699976.1 hypothetical protein CPR_C0048 [Clostridium phage phiSM101]ABG87889.1 hypothetical protein CPR_C0048 [Clostridium phage phiSM101]MBO3408107.1 hypothetical protein [Clostridium perfringens]SQB59681.1 Uncharacterised protein [Clostridium perfringens]HAT4295948.1 hypothetical protein [Clostridium perfringens]